ncbi:MAG TPA: archease [Candidatus Nanoarchaeia archaeon]|nr:archease [Candidatus Nanoarchaeia archaeon]
MGKRQPFEFLDHTADIKVRVHGKTLPEIFENVALAVSYYLAGEKKSRPRLMTQISVSANDNEALLYAFVDELLYLVDAEHFLVAKAEVTLVNGGLRARVYGDSTARYDVKQIKAATYAEMAIEQDLRGWTATLVLDV